MNTSYFAKSAKHPNAIAICRKVPDWYKGPNYLKLAPTWDIISEYRLSGSEVLFTRRYKWAILDPLDPEQVYEELGPDAVLLCYEAKGKFCHRQLVAEWLNNALRKKGIMVTEL